MSRTPAGILAALAWSALVSAAWAPAVASFGTSLPPCCVHVPPVRTNTQTAPLLSSLEPPIKAVSPSAESATLTPKAPFPDSPLPVSLLPFWMSGSIVIG